MTDKIIIEALSEVGITDSNFLDYMNHNRVRRYDAPADLLIWGCWIDTDAENNISDIKIIVPYPIDEQTLLINIHEYTHAYESYLRLGKPYMEDIEKSEKSARLNEHLYLSRKRKINV